MSADVSECGPIATDIAVIAVSTSSGATDLSTLLTNTNKRRFRMICSQPLYYRFDTATGTADETATSGANKVTFLPAGELSPPMRLRYGRAADGEAPGTAQWLIHKAGGAGHVRLYFCDQPTG